VWLVNQMVETGFINSIRDIWWDVRPHHNFGTVEIRVCDMPGTLDDVLGITALTQCLVRALSEEIDGGTYQHDCHPMLVRQNKWRAARIGLEAQLVDEETHKARPDRQVIREQVARLRPTAEARGCRDELEYVIVMAGRPTGADRQIAIARETGEPGDGIRRLVAQARLSPSRP
jgi:carboxylate-amine ligase